MAKKIYDLTVKVGSWETPEGVQKGKYKNVGSVIQKDDGGEFILIDPLFNFAGVQRDEGRDMVIVSKFEVKEKQTGEGGEYE